MAGKPDPFGKIRHPKKRAFLAAMANTANVLRAAEIAGIDRDNHYLWLKKDPDYATAFEIARGRGADALEAEAVRRAHEGVTKPIFHGGKPIGIPAAVREYSDTLLIFLLKGRNPAVFSDRLKQEHGGLDDKPIPVIILPPITETDPSEVQEMALPEGRVKR